MSLAVLRIAFRDLELEEINFLVIVVVKMVVLKSINNIVLYEYYFTKKIWIFSFLECSMFNLALSFKFYFHQQHLL